MDVMEWLEKVSEKVQIEDKDIGTHFVYVSKYDGSYITMEGQEKNVKYLAKHEITDQLTHGVGFSPKDDKWYGWSHRAIYGFTIGSTCEKGDCHYQGSSEEAQKEAAIAFWDDEGHENTRCIGVNVNEQGERFFIINWEYSDDIPNEKLRNHISGVEHFIAPVGKGEWVAETMEDAKQMAIDFNAGVS